MDRRRVEDAFFQYAALRVASWYPEQFKIPTLQFHAMTTMTISNMTTVYHGAFMKKYSGSYVLVSAWLLGEILYTHQKGFHPVG